MALVLDLIGLGMPPALAELLAFAIEAGTPGEPIPVTGSPAVILPGTRFIAIQRDAPTATALTLPSVSDQNGTPLLIADWSTNVTSHTITLTPTGGNTVELLSSWPMVSNPAFLVNAMFYPSTELNGWVVSS